MNPMKPMLLCAIALGLTGCARESLGPISTEYKRAGGGDPRYLPGDTLDGWMASHQLFAKQLKQRCMQELPRLERTQYGADYRVCSSANWMAFEPIVGDNRKF